MSALSRLWKSGTRGVAKACSFCVSSPPLHLVGREGPARNATLGDTALNDRRIAKKTRSNRAIEQGVAGRWALSTRYSRGLLVRQWLLTETRTAFCRHS